MHGLGRRCRGHGFPGTPPVGLRPARSSRAAHAALRRPRIAATGSRSTDCWARFSPLSPPEALAKPRLKGLFVGSPEGSETENLEIHLGEVAELIVLDVLGVCRSAKRVSDSPGTPWRTVTSTASCCGL